MAFTAKNYICINGKKTELTKEQLKQLGISNETIYLSDDGKIAHVGDHEFIVINKNPIGHTVSLLLKNSLCDMRFGHNNDFRESDIKKRLEEFAEEISKIVGKENLLEHTVDLTANDGLKCYGKTKARMSLFTAQMARKNVDILDDFKLNDWWWLVTPYGTPKHEECECVMCVSTRGSIAVNDCNYGSVGVRPFCVLKSNIFNS